MWSILEKMFHVHLNVYSDFFGCNVLKMSIVSNFSIVSFRISVALLIFCLVDLSIDVSGVLKSPTITVVPSISPFTSVSLCCMYLGAPILGAYMLTIVLIFFLNRSFYICYYLLKVSGCFSIRGLYIDDYNILFLNGSFNHNH